MEGDNLMRRTAEFSDLDLFHVLSNRTQVYREALSDAARMFEDLKLNRVLPSEAIRMGEYIRRLLDNK